MSVLIDAGATDSFFREFFRTYLQNRRKSRTKIMIADSRAVWGDCEGNLPFFVMNTANDNNTGLGKATVAPATIVPEMDQDLMAVTHFFEALGYEVHLRPDGPSEMTKTLEDGSVDRIPMRWDAEKKGFFMDIVLTKDTRKLELAAAHMMDLMDFRSTSRVKARRVTEVEQINLEKVVMSAMRSKMVEGGLTTCAKMRKAAASQPSDPLNCRLGLSGNNRKLTRKQAAKLFAHIGCSDPECWVLMNLCSP